MAILALHRSAPWPWPSPILMCCTSVPVKAVFGIMSPTATVCTVPRTVEEHGAVGVDQHHRAFAARRRHDICRRDALQAGRHGAILAEDHRFRPDLDED